jgi:hypothetical protein
MPLNGDFVLSFVFILFSALLLLIAEPEAIENSSVSRKTQTRCHNEFVAFLTFVVLYD